MKDAKGNPTGLLRERAQELVRVPRDFVESRERKKVELAAKECLSKGIASFQDAGSSLTVPEDQIRDAEVLYTSWEAR